LINVGRISAGNYDWALNELHQSVHYYGYFDKNQADYLFSLAIGSDGNAQWAKQQILNNVLDITVDDLYYMYVLGDMTVTQNDRDIETAIKRKLYKPVFEHGLEIFADGLVTGASLLDGVYLAGAVKEAILARTGRVIASEAVESSRVSDILYSVKNSGKGNTSIGSGTTVEAWEAGKAWVGPGAKPIMDGDRLIGYSSSDGLRAFRLDYKPRLGKTQANFQQNTLNERTGAAKQVFNARLDILD
jgi:hypothetical protein